jgi:hypothetical protein
MEPLTSVSYQEALARRREMQERLSALESAAAAATGSSDWPVNVGRALTGLHQALAHHILAVESSDGLLADIVSTAPRLANSVQSMRDDHGRLAAHIERLLREVETTEPGEVRADVTELLHEMMLHRQRGSDLVYEAFARDIGGIDS